MTSDPRRWVALWARNAKTRLLVELGTVAGSFPTFKQVDDYTFVSTDDVGDEFVSRMGHPTGPIARRAFSARKSGWKR